VLQLGYKVGSPMVPRGTPRRNMVNSVYYMFVESSE
jgi:hypothetical protein